MFNSLFYSHQSKLATTKIAKFLDITSFYDPYGAAAMNLNRDYFIIFHSTISSVSIYDTNVVDISYDFWSLLVHLLSSTTIPAIFAV